MPCVPPTYRQRLRYCALALPGSPAAGQHGMASVTSAGFLSRRAAPDAVRWHCARRSRRKRAPSRAPAASRPRRSGAQEQAQEREQEHTRRAAPGRRTHGKPNLAGAPLDMSDRTSRSSVVRAVCGVRTGGHGKYPRCCAPPRSRHTPHEQFARACFELRASSFLATHSVERNRRKRKSLSRSPLPVRTRPD